MADMQSFGLKSCKLIKLLNSPKIKLMWYKRINEQREFGVLLVLQSIRGLLYQYGKGKVNFSSKFVEY